LGRALLARTRGRPSRKMARVSRARSTTPLLPDPDQALDFVAPPGRCACDRDGHLARRLQILSRKPDGDNPRDAVGREIHRRLPIRSGEHGSSSFAAAAGRRHSIAVGEMPQTWGVPVEENRSLSLKHACASQYRHDCRLARTAGLPQGPRANQQTNFPIRANS